MDDEIHLPKLRHLEHARNPASKRPERRKMAWEWRHAILEVQ